MFVRVMEVDTLKRRVSPAQGTCVRSSIPGSCENCDPVWASAAWSLSLTEMLTGLAVKTKVGWAQILSLSAFIK